VIRFYYDNKCTKEFKQIIDQTKSKSQKKTTEYMKQRKTRNSFVGRNKDPIPSNNSSRIWSSDEKQLFMQSLQEVGKDFDAIAQKIKTKNVPQIKNFYNNYRRKLNLDMYLPNNKQ